MASYIWGGNTGIKSPEELERRRAVAEAMLARAVGRTPQNVGEGLTAVGQAIGGRLAENRLNKAERAGRESANDAFSEIIRSLGGGGQTSAYTPSVTPADPVNSRIDQAFTDAGDMSPYADAIAIFQFIRVNSQLLRLVFIYLVDYIRPEITCSTRIKCPCYNDFKMLFFRYLVIYRNHVPVSHGNIIHLAVILYFPKRKMLSNKL